MHQEVVKIAKQNSLNSDPRDVGAAFYHRAVSKILTRAVATIAVELQGVIVCTLSSINIAQQILRCCISLFAPVASLEHRSV